MELREDLLYHIWKFRLYELPLLDLDEEPVEMIDPGQQNPDAGPDFFNARMRCGEILWAGNVEIHRKASEWYQHEHHLDPVFDNVILHVVLEPDCEVRNSKGRRIRTARMNISASLRLRYEMLMESPDYIPCWREIGKIRQAGMNIWLERLLVERLEERIHRIGNELESCTGDWNEVLYRILARAFGQKVNAEPFDMLARSLPLWIIRLCKGNRMDIEALLFGQAGFLDSPEVPVSLERRYRKLAGEYDLKAMDVHVWKFLRLRPDNFPTIRISQLAGSLVTYPELTQHLIDAQDPPAFVMGMKLRASEYWTRHYRFGRVSPAREKRIGTNRLRGLYINAFLPFLCAYYRTIGKPWFMEDLTENARKIPAEDNRIIRMWRSLGVEVPDLLYSQALLQLSNYCKFKRCLSCYVGSQIIKSNPCKK